MIIIVAGVSGTGKSTIGKMVAESLQLPFYDADDFHPIANVNKMKGGSALNDDDRRPWLETLAKEIALWQKDKGAVLACSALKEAYRDILSAQCKTNIKWVILSGSTEILTNRLNARVNHFMSAKLLQSQLDILELPDYGWIIDVQPSPEVIVKKILDKIHK